MELKKITILTLVVLLLVGCSKPAVKSLGSSQSETAAEQSKDEQKDDGQTVDPGQELTDVVLEFTKDWEEIDPASERGKTVAANPATSAEQIAAQQQQNAVNLQDYLAANPHATPVPDRVCWVNSDNQSVYLWDDRPDTPAFNRIIQDPLVGDERNFIFIREARDDYTTPLKIEHMLRDDTLISHQLEPGKKYEMLLYINNNAVYDPDKPETTIGTATGTEFVMELPKAVGQEDSEEGKKDEIIASFFGSNAPGIASSAQLTCDQPVTLHWGEEVACYTARGEYAMTRSLRNSENKGAAVILMPDNFVVELAFSDNYLSNLSLLFSLEFYVDPEQKEPTMSEYLLDLDVDTRKK